jgi:hypothetical protein
MKVSQLFRENVMSGSFGKVQGMQKYYTSRKKHFDHSTYIYIIRQHLVRHSVFLQNVVVNRGAGSDGAEEEPKQPISYPELSTQEHTNKTFQ